MLEVNEYFEGHVKSIALQTATLPATVGVMAVGEYTFGTSERETMRVVSGALTVRLPAKTTGRPSRRAPPLSSLPIARSM